MPYGIRLYAKNFLGARLLNLKAFSLTKVRIIGTIILATVMMIGVVLTLRFSSAYGTWYSMSSDSGRFLALWYMSFFVGLLFTWRLASDWGGNHRLRVSEQLANRCVIIFSLFALLGTLILTYEFAYRRGYGFTTAVHDIRMLEVSRASRGPTGSWLGGVGRLFVPALIAAWVLVSIRWRQMRWIPVVVLALSTVLVFMYQLRFEGGRFFFVSLALCAFVASMANFIEGVDRPDSAPKLGDLKFRHLAPMAMALGLLIGTMFYSSLVTIDRGVSSVDRIAEIIQIRSQQSEEIRKALDLVLARGASGYEIAYLQYALNFPIDVSNLETSGSFDAWDYRNGMAWLYITQGTSQLDLILSKDDHVLAGGFYQFPQLAILAGKILGQDLRYDEAQNLPIYGAYITLAGASYIDFGFIGSLLYAATLGALIRISVNSVFSRDMSVVAFLGPCLLTIALFSPITSLVPTLWPSMFWLVVPVTAALWRIQTGRA